VSKHRRSRAKVAAEAQEAQEAQVAQVERAKAAGARLEPLRCAKCGMPLPVGDADDSVRCPGCGATAPVPEPHRLMRDAHRMSASDAAQLDALAADISRPPPAWERVAVVVGYGVGILTLVVLALGAIVGAIGGFIVSDKLGGNDTLTKVVVGIGVIVCGVISVPFVGECIVGFIHLQDLDAAMSLTSAPHLQLSADLTVAGVLYFLGVVPIAVAWRTSQSISNLEALQAKLAAQPATTPGGASSCRQCGAALDVRPGALAAKCIYCDAENLLTVPHAYAAKKKEDARAIDVEVQAAVRAHDEVRRSDRAAMWGLLAVGPLLAPVLCAAGWLMHKILSS
jgi:predicted Zn-ribbon and HTH transcriptional regulator